MQPHPEKDESSETTGRGGLLIAGAVVLVIVALIVLHLTGVIGPHSH
jgi:hypothetical protein